MYTMHTVLARGIITLVPRTLYIIPYIPRILKYVYRAAAAAADDCLHACLHAVRGSHNLGAAVVRTRVVRTRVV